MLFTFSSCRFISFRTNITLLLIAAIIFEQQVIYVHAAGDHEPTAVSSPEFWGQIIAIIALVVCSGIVAGLTLGLMSQDTTNLAILSAAGTAKQQKHAARIMPIRKNGHLLLTALLLTNTVLNETLPILCDGLFGKGYVAVIISTALIVLFSEILPQAVCSRHGLAIGAFFAIPVRVLIGFWYILAWPIAKLLDILLGKNSGVMYRVAELRELISLHGGLPSPSCNDQHATGPLHNSTVQVLCNTLDLSLFSAGELVNPARQPFMLHIDTQLDNAIMNSILQSECTAIPVYRYRNSNDAGDDDINGEPHRIILGVLKTKHLSVLDPADKTPLKKITLEPVLQVSSSTPAVKLLQMLESDTNRMAEVFMPIGPVVSDSETAPMSCACSSKEHNIDDAQPNYCSESYRTKRSSASCCITRKIRHHERSEKNENKGVAKPDKQQKPQQENEKETTTIAVNDRHQQHMVPDMGDDASSSTSSSSHHAYSPDAQDTVIVGMITLEEILEKLIGSNSGDAALLTSVLIHAKMEDSDHDKVGANTEQQRLSHHPKQYTMACEKASSKNEWEDRSATRNKETEAKSCRSSNSSTTESTVISKTNSLSRV